MWLRLAALADLTAVLCIPAHAQSRAVLTLDDAFARGDQSHPELRLLQSQRVLLGGDRDRASLQPPLLAGASVETPWAMVRPTVSIGLRSPSAWHRFLSAAASRVHASCSHRAGSVTSLRKFPDFMSGSAAVRVLSAHFHSKPLEFQS